MRDAILPSKHKTGSGTLRNSAEAREAEMRNWSVMLEIGEASSPSRSEIQVEAYMYINVYYMYIFYSLRNTKSEDLSN